MSHKKVDRHTTFAIQFNAPCYVYIGVEF